MQTAASRYGLPIAASLGLHGLLLLVAVVGVMFSPGKGGAVLMSRAPDPLIEEEVPQVEEPEDVVVTFIPSEPEPEIKKPEKKKPLLPSEQEAELAEKKPQGPIHIVSREDIPVLAPLDVNTPFISDRNMRAAATSAPTPGADPRIGNQEGHDLPGVSLFKANPSNTGSTPPPPAPAPPPTPDPVAAQRPPEPPPPAQPQEDRPRESASVQTSDPNAPAAQKKPAEIPEMRETIPDPLSMAEAKYLPPRPRTPRTPPVDPVRPDEDNKLPGRKPVVSSVKTKVAGGLAEQGDEASVDAKDTPEGRFLSAMHDSIGLIWNGRLATVRGLAGTGSVEVEFDIDLNSRVSNVRLVDPGKANPVFEDVCITSIIKARIPPLPESLKRELRDPLSGGKLRRKVSFTRL